MSLAYSIMCDDDSGCGMTAAAVPSSMGLAAYRELLREQGWSSLDRRGRDFCPDCTCRRAERLVVGVQGAGLYVAEREESP